MRSLKQIFFTLRFIASHPFSKSHKLRGWSHFVYWQLLCLFSKKSLTVKFTEKSKIILSKGLRGATGNYYCGFHEFSDMCFLLHFLRPGDLFGDVGANIGSYTILASAHVGAETISIEAVPGTCQWLQKNIQSNGIEQLVTPLQTAVGSKKGKVYFTAQQDAMNHILEDFEPGCIEVPCDTLDSVFENRVPLLIKIDVEGFEAEVLSGAFNTIANPALKALIVEMGNHVMPGENIRAHEWICHRGFLPYSYDPFNRTLSELNRNHFHNTIYLRDKDWTKQRIKTAPVIELWGEKI